MVIILKQGAPQEKINELYELLKKYDVTACPTVGEMTTILGLVGDTAHVDISELQAQDIVERVTRVSEPYKRANRKFHPLDTVIDVAGRKVGSQQLAVIAGPCSVESREQIVEVAQRVKASGANFLRGGAFKPRTSPYSFQGLSGTGIELLLEAKKMTGLPIVTELMSTAHLSLFEDVDVIQVGARNMQNFEMLKELGKIDKPILLKRGLANTIEELLMSAEYIMSGGNEKVILCERGIRTFEPFTRNTVDLAAVPILKRVSHLPVVVDPSHATGLTWLVEPIAKAAIAAGADGVMIEVHNNPQKALSDGAQSITPDQFDDVMEHLRGIAACEGRTL